MFKDPIVEEVRKIREELAEKANFDLEEIFAQALKRQKESKTSTVSYSKAKKEDPPKIAQQ